MDDESVVRIFMLIGIVIQTTIKYLLSLKHGFFNKENLFSDILLF